MRFGKSDDAQVDLFERYQTNGTSKILELAHSDNKAGKIALIIGAIVVLLVASYLTGFVMTITDDAIPFADKLSLSPWKYMLKTFTTIKGVGVMLFLSLMIVVIALLISKKNKELDTVKETDERGVNYSEAGTYGTAEWMSRKEAAKEYEIGNIDDVRGVILGQYTEKGKECICLPEDTEGNRNILVLGSPGTGKSFCYIRNAVFQAAKRGESIVITDPKGELFESTSEGLRQRGYKIKLFNLVDLLRSDAWDCMREIYDPVTGDISEIRATEFVDAIMKNTGESKGDSFWDSGECNLLKAIVMFCAWRREQDLIANYEKEGTILLDKLADVLTSEEAETLREILYSNSSAHMKDRETALEMLIKLTEGKDTVESRMFEIQNRAATCNIGTVYEILVTSDLKKLEESHPAGIAWSIFKNSPDGTRPNMVQGLAQRLQLFQMRDIRRITTNDDIRFEEMGSEKTALFCIISDKSTAMKALTSLFFTFLFKDVEEAADRFGPKNRLYVNVLCDEFANLGIIPGFETIISTARSRRVNISIVLQSVIQLNRNYKESRETIQSCCDTVLFLGCNDTETAKYISDLSGVASIRVLSTSDQRNNSLGNRAMLQGYKLSEGAGKRNLLNSDEVRRLPREDVIIYHNGRNILQAHRCGYIEHPYYREGIPEVHLRDYPLASKKYSSTEDKDAFIIGDLQRQRAINAAIEEKNARDKEFASQTFSKNSSDNASVLGNINDPDSIKTSHKDHNFEF